MRKLHIGARRLLATAALLLASSLEICGCLSPGELATLAEGQARDPMASTTMPYRSGETLRQALHEDGGPLFYQATSTLNRPTASSQVSDFNSLEMATSSTHPTLSEVRFAPWSIPESVLFLYREVESGGMHQRAPSATAFVLSVPDRDNRTLARFLVTARHVVDPAWAYCSERNPTSIQVRLNRRSGGVGYETISLLNVQGGLRYFTPRDPTADIAILRLDRQLIPNVESYKFVDTPYSLLATESELGYISSRHGDPSRNVPGQPVTTASLRTQVPAELSAFPISQSGTLFSTENEPVNIQCGDLPAPRPLHVWFIGASVEQGVSGAPVYTLLTREGESSPSTVLLGVQAITWPDRAMAGITPASALADLVQTALETPRHHRNDASAQQADLYRGVVPLSRPPDKLQ